jgi:23S rRNA pseudouridine2605 synthase
VLSGGLVRVVVHEGRYRQVRRMLDAVGHPVRRLVRTRIGPVTDHRLAPGAWRPLTTSEVRALSLASVTRPAPERSPTGRSSSPSRRGGTADR